MTFVLVVGLLGACQAPPAATPAARAAAAITPRFEVTATPPPPTAVPATATMPPVPAATATATATRAPAAPPAVGPCPPGSVPAPGAPSDLPARQVLTPENVGGLTAFARWGRGAPRDLRYSPDGRWLAASWSGGSALFDACTLEERGALEHTGALAFSPDSRLLAVSGQQGLQVRRVPDLGLAYRLSLGGDGYANQVQFSPDGAVLAASGGATIGLFRASDGQPLRQLATQGDEVTGLAFAPDGASLIAVDRGWTSHHNVYSFTIRRWRVADGALLVAVRPDGDHRNPILSPDGGIVASTGYSARPTLWRFAGDTLTRLSGIPSGLALAISDDNADVLVSAEDGQLQRWRVAGGTLIATLRTFPYAIAGAAFRADRATIAVLDATGGLHLLGREDGHSLGTTDGLPLGSPTLVMPDSATVVTSATSAANRGVLTVRRLADGTPIRTIVTDSGSIMALDVSADGAIVASSGWNLAIQLWDVADGRLIRTMAGQTDEAEAIAFSPDGRYLAAVQGDRALLVWRLDDGALLFTLPKPTVGFVRSVAFAPDSRSLLVAEEEGKLRQYDSESGALLDEIPTIPGAITRPSGFVAAGTVLVTYDRDAIHLWDWAGRTLLHEFPLGARITGTAISRDGRLLALVRDDGMLTLFRVDDETAVHTMTIPATRKVRFLPDGTALVSFGAAGALRVWGVPR